MFSFEILKKDADTEARTAKIVTGHGVVDTPCFMPVATQATVKGITPADLGEMGFSMLIVNAYHMYLRPGVDRVRKLGGLHRFMAWDFPIATDSGGFQALSLSKVRKITDEGILFQSHLDGSEHMLSPEKAVEVQEGLGSDIMMCLDECAPYPSSYEYVEKSTALTTKWAERCMESRKLHESALFGIVQGGVYEDLRKKSAQDLIAMNFEGYAIGGLGIGESKEYLYGTTKRVSALLPYDKPRYLMGVGEPGDIVEAVSYGVDMFDCVLPTRNARNGYLFTNHGKVVIKNSRYSDDPEPIDKDCGCYVCRNFSRAYLRHLYQAGEILAPVLLTMHNLYFFARLMDDIRNAVEKGTYDEFMYGFKINIGDDRN